MTKTGNFETDVDSGYYRWERDNTKDRTFDSDFRAWLLTKGVPEKYVDRVASAAYERGHAFGEEEIVSSSWSFIGIFE